VLYLAEVIQKKGGLMGGSKTELKLLACQRTEQNWTAVTGEEVVPGDEASRYAAGTLLLADLTNSRQVQRIQEAGRPLVSILQNFSRLQEKFKTQEEEIEQWKQSLTYQSQELNRREMEMEARREQLDQMESDAEQMESQREQFEQVRTEVEGQKEEFDRQKQELEGAWDQLRGEMNRLEDRKSEIQQGAVLDTEKAQHITGLLQRVEGAIASMDTVQEQTGFAQEVIGQQQSQLQTHWDRVGEYRSQLEAQQTELDASTKTHQVQWQQWRDASDGLEKAKAELQVQQSMVQAKQDYAQALILQLQHHEEIHHQLYRMTEGLDDVNIAGQVDVATLEAMNIETLQSLISDISSDFKRSSDFVSDQEEELELKQKEIDELEHRVTQANAFDRLNLENELTDERDAYQFLNQTLVGQRRSVREKESVLRQHQTVLARRQGKPDPYASENGFNLGPVFAQIDSFRQQRSEELVQIEMQIAQIRSSIEQTQSMVTQQEQCLMPQHQALLAQDQTLQDKRVLLANSQAKLALYDEMLQPFQDKLTDLKGRVEFITRSLSEFSQSGHDQRQALAQVQESFASLVQEPQLAA
jgi:chromosome segregation ATPase